MASPREEALEALGTFVTRELIAEPSLELAADEDLLASGLLDSLGVMRLVRFIEENFQLEVPPADVVIEHFMTLDAILDYLNSRGKDFGSGED